MARKRHHKRKSHSRRRKMSGMGSGVIMEVVGITAGAAIGRIVSNKLFPTMNASLKSAAVLGIGAFLMPKLIKGSMGANLGAGMIASGGLGVLQGTGVLGAIDDAMEGFPSVGAIQDIGTIDYSDEMSGLEADDEMGAMDEEGDDY